MTTWLHLALLAAVLWGVVGLLQKLGSNRISASSLLIWVTVGYLLAIPLFWKSAGLGTLSGKALLLGVVAGSVNGVGTWLLFAAFERGAKASVAVPLTALYPLVTVALAYFFLSERLDGLQWLGVFLAICAGGMLSHKTDH
jgi:transporter family protein